MKVIIHIKGGASSVSGGLPVKDEEGLAKFLVEAPKFFLMKQEPPKSHPVVISKSSIGYVERKQ